MSEEEPQRATFFRGRFRFYVAEFVLVFSAVFLGFLADNLREKFSDDAKERTLVESLVRNLVSDSLQLQRMIAENVDKANHLDSALLYKDFSLEDTVKAFHFLWHTTKGLTHVFLFKNNNATLEQLKTGGFSTLPQYVMDSIADYDTRLQDIYTEESQYTHNNWRTYEISQELIHYADITPKDAYRYFDFNPPQVRLLHNAMWDLRYSVKGYSMLLQTQLRKARSLIVFLKKEYDL
jgi:hypothetical protein